MTPCVSADKVSEYEQGNVGEVVQRHGPWRSRDVYVAGNEAMVHDVHARLRAEGVADDRIHSEVFAPSRPGPSVDGEVTQ